MGKYRSDLNERFIRFALVNGHTVGALAGKYGCSESLIRNIRDGVTRRGNKRQPPPVQNKEDIPAEELCVCCEINPRAPGNRFLCVDCYRNGDVGTIA